MGHVFTDKVDVTKLKEGVRARIVTHSNEVYDGILSKDNEEDWWLCADELMEHYGMDSAFAFDNHGKYGSYLILENGLFYPESLELLDADPGDKMQAEHAEMLEIIGAAAEAPWSNGDIRRMARDFLAKRKAQQ